MASMCESPYSAIKVSGPQSIQAIQLETRGLNFCHQHSHNTVCTTHTITVLYIMAMKSVPAWNYKNVEIWFVLCYVLCVYVAVAHKQYSVSSSRSSSSLRIHNYSVSSPFLEQRQIQRGDRLYGATQPAQYWPYRPHTLIPIGITKSTSHTVQ